MTRPLALSVILPTRNPNPGRLARTLNGLADQTLDRSTWEVILVDNASDSGWSPPAGTSEILPRLRLVREERVGLTAARLRGLAEARGEICVFVDDDNVLDPRYLAGAHRAFSVRPRLGAAGGPVRPEWEKAPEPWTEPFHGLLALRDLGAAEHVQPGGPGAAWPDFAPVGAGLAVRRSLALAYAGALRSDPHRMGLDRTASSLGSGGDNDLVFTILRTGADIAYLPDLGLLHLIPASRLQPEYLARLNRGIMRTWVRVLAIHGACPWPPIQPWTVRLRYLRAALRVRGGPEAALRVRRAGLLGQFEGQADLRRLHLP